MSRYQQGAAVERQVAEHLGTLGYDVIRSAASKGAADLVAIHDGQVLLVQVKKNETTRVSPAERRELVRMATRIGAVPMVAHRMNSEHDKRRSLLVYYQLTGTGPKDRADWTPLN